jgi:hypothetical protein
VPHSVGFLVSTWASSWFHYSGFPVHQARNRSFVRYLSKDQTRTKTKAGRRNRLRFVGPAWFLPNPPLRSTDSSPAPYRVGSIAIGSNRRPISSTLPVALDRDRDGQFILHKPALLGTRQTSPGTLSYLNGQPPN